MIPTTHYMERPAAMPVPAPIGAVGLGHGTHGTSMPSFTQHRTAFASAMANAVKPWTFRICRQVELTTDRSARHLGRRST